MINTKTEINVNKINLKYNKFLDYMCYALEIYFAGLRNNPFFQANVVLKTGSNKM
jgi:hypothetical protein